MAKVKNPANNPAPEVVNDEQEIVDMGYFSYARN